MIRIRDTETKSRPMVNVDLGNLDADEKIYIELLSSEVDLKALSKV